MTENRTKRTEDAEKRTTVRYRTQHIENLLCRNQTINSIGYFLYYNYCNKDVALHEEKPEDVSYNHHTGSWLRLGQFFISLKMCFRLQIYFFSLYLRIVLPHKTTQVVLLCTTGFQKYASNSVITTELGILSTQVNLTSPEAQLTCTLFKVNYHSSTKLVQNIAQLDATQKQLKLITQRYFYKGRVYLWGEGLLRLLLL